MRPERASCGAVIGWSASGLTLPGCALSTGRLSDDGVRSASQVLTSAEHHETLLAVEDVLRALHARLRRADCLTLLGLPHAASVLPPRPELQLEAIFRLSADYFLRAMELLLPHFSSPSQAFILQEVVRANTAEMSDSLRGENATGVAALVPDDFRKPVGASAVAKQLGLPLETARRNLTALVDAGRCVRQGAGFIVPAAVLAGPNLSGAYAPNFQNLRRMFSALAELGVLACWETDAETTRHQTRLSRQGRSGC